MDRLYYNGCIRTLNAENHIVEAVGTRDGNIVFVGTTQDGLAQNWSETIDLQGKLMLPGFVDSHLHFLSYAFLTSSLPLFHCRSVDDILSGAKASYEAGKAHNQTFVFGRGWNEGLFDQPAYPHKDQLDAISTEIPMLVVRVCGHVAVSNTKGLELLAKLPQFHEFASEVDFETGLIKENAVQFYYSILEAPPQELVEEYILKGQADVNKAGITGVQSDDFGALPGKNWQRILGSLIHLSQEGKMTARVYEQCLFEQVQGVKNFIDAGHRTGDGNDFFRIGPIKLLQDGSLGAKTAALEEPYEGDESNVGIFVFSPEELTDMITYCDQHNMQVAVHCIGDRAMNMVLDAIDSSPYRDANSKNRHGIVHAQITSAKTLKHMADKNILAYIQPVFVDLDMDVVESRIGKERMANTYAWKTMLDMGIHAMGGSDAPVVPFNIMENIYFAVTRENMSMQPEGGWIPQECLDIDRAVRLFSQYPHYGSYTEDVAGSIEVGKWADLVVLERNIYEIPPREIKDVAVTMTVVNGKTVYQL